MILRQTTLTMFILCLGLSIFASSTYATVAVTDTVADTDTAKATRNVKTVETEVFIEVIKKFTPVEEKIGESDHLLFLACKKLLDLKKSDKNRSALLDEIILLYNRHQKVETNYFSFEHLVPYYSKDSEVVKKAITRLLSVKDAKEFNSNLNLAIETETRNQD